MHPRRLLLTSPRTIRNANFITLFAILAIVSSATAQMADTVYLDIEAANGRSYRYDNSDPSKFGVEAGPTTAVIAPNFQQWVTIQDLRFANGRPVKGVIVFRVTRIAMSPTPGPNGAVGDVVRSAVIDFAIEMLDQDGRPLGGLTANGLFGGTPPTDPLRPLGGPPAGFAFDDFAGSVAITGGTGIFIGARGYLVSGPAPLNLPSISQPLPDGSITENPRNRRVVGPLPNVRFILVLLPAYRPSVVRESDHPLIYHEDLSLVTSENPARAGEIIVMRVTGLGPTSPGLLPGSRFPLHSPHFRVVAPVEANIDGKPSDVLTQIGWPETSEQYRLDVRIPEGIPAGPTSLTITAGFVPSAPISIPLR